MAEKKPSEEVKELEPEILKYISERWYRRHLDRIKEDEKYYDEYAAKCSELMIPHGVGIMSRLTPTLKRL